MTPATSTESERMFSKAGLVVSEKRSFYYILYLILSSLNFNYVTFFLFFCVELDVVFIPLQKIY